MQEVSAGKASSSDVYEKKIASLNDELAQLRGQLGRFAVVRIFATVVVLDDSFTMTLYRSNNEPPLTPSLSPM